MFQCGKKKKKSVNIKVLVSLNKKGSFLVQGQVSFIQFSPQDTSRENFEVDSGAKAVS